MPITVTKNAITLGTIKAFWRKANAFAEEAYNAPYRSAIARAQRDQDDLFMLLVYSELMGIPNPAQFYTMELQPLMLERFHQWHQRMGMEHSPLDNFRCC